MGKEAGRKNYTVEEKMEALKILEAIGGNLTATARLTGINRDTIRRWSKQYGSDLRQAEYNRKVVTEVRSC